MTREEIEAFLAIARFGSLSEAARQINISQPALGKRLISLEDELGRKLVDRKRGVRQAKLTESGHAFVPFAEKFIDTIDNMKSMKERSDGETLRIASSDGPNLHVLNDAYTEFKSRRPDVFLRIQTHSYRECYRRVADRKLDAALVGINYYCKSVIAQPAYREDMVLICRTDSDYPDSLDLRDLSVGNCIYSPYSSEFIVWFDSWFRMQGDPLVECDLVEQTMRLMRDLGKDVWTIVPASSADVILENPLFEMRNVKNEMPRRTIHLIKNIDQQSGALALFEEILAEKLQASDRIKSLI